MSKICDHCGNKIPDGAELCPGCGKKQFEENTLENILSEFSLNQEEQQEQTDAPETEAPQKKSADPAIAAIETQTKKNMEGKKTSAKTKKPVQAGSSGSSALAIIVGILIALLLVAGIAFFMLYRMGFFDLLGTDQTSTSPSSQPVQTFSTGEVENPVQEAAPIEEPVDMDSMEESLVEESSLEEPVATPEPAAKESDEPMIEVDKFNLTGADDMTFTSRGETAQIVYVIAPESAESEIKWTSSDETVATVSANGVITARRGGNCTVTGKCGTKEVSIAVRCSFTVPTTVLDMNYSDITMDHEGQEVQLKIDYDLTEKQEKSTVWESSDPKVASVSDDGLVTALRNGTVVISASIGDYTASCIVRCLNVTGNKGVNPDDSEYVINYEDVTLSRKGEYFQLSLKSILGNDLPEHTWKSNDVAVATVDAKGVVTAVADGTCKITTSIGDDDFECIVRVHITG